MIGRRRSPTSSLGLDRTVHRRHLAAAAGATTKELMERIGHTSPAVALRYQPVMADREAALAAALHGLARQATRTRAEDA